MINETKQTAVEWLIQKLINKQNGVFDGFPYLSVDEIYDKAKEMEREQMIEFGAKCLQSQNENSTSIYTIKLGHNTTTNKLPNGINKKVEIVQGGFCTTNGGNK